VIGPGGLWFLRSTAEDRPGPVLEACAVEAPLVPTPAQVLALDRPGPRYTSYPTVPAWTSEVGDDDLDRAIAALDAPVSVYVHVPFCKEQCWFCGCNQVVSRRRSAGDEYLTRLERELERVGRRDLRISRLHVGGGTPTWLDIPQLERLFSLVDRLGNRLPGAEVSVEVDPDLTSPEQIDTLAACGTTRVSVGVQSTDPQVLAAVHRPQDTARVRACLERSRHHGMRGLNVDLVYGLPYQTPENLQTTLTDVLVHAPDRLAVYSYAHVPWSKPHQKNIDAERLPGPVEKLRLFLLAEQRLLDEGYVKIGMDHFARPDDELAVAAAAGVLHRNFMGYTTRADLPVVGLGVSAISELPGLYTQAHTHLGTWNRAVDHGAHRIERGIRLTTRDRVVKDVISELMCNLRLDEAALASRHGIDFAATFPDLDARLAPLVAQGLVEREAGVLQVTELGRYLVRLVAMGFDDHLHEGAGYSRAI
jgi:oxygen-independent coproporphyrinogen-3 oxidase